MTTLVPLGAADGRTAWNVEGGGRRLAVFLVDGGYYATDARCPHRGGPLAEGWVRDPAGTPVLTCPSHWYRFDLRTGRCLTNAVHELACYAVVERDGALYAEVPEPAPARSWSEILRAHARGEA